MLFLKTPVFNITVLKYKRTKIQSLQFWFYRPQLPPTPPPIPLSHLVSQSNKLWSVPDQKKNSFLVFDTDD